MSPVMIDPRRLRALRRLAWVLFALMLAVTVASATIRLAQPRPLCSDWPVCRAMSVPGSRPALSDWPQALPSEAAVRGIHRVAATLALLVVVALTWLTLARRPREPGAGALALGLLLLALGLSALGIVTPGSRSIAVTLGNQLGGLLMLALAWRLTRHLGGESPAGAHGLGVWALAGAGLWLVQAALGAMSGAGVGIWPSLAHSALALAPAAAALGVGLAARRGGLRAEGGALIAVGAGQWLLGGGAMLLDASTALVLAHNLNAGLGLALLVGLAGRGRARVGEPA